MKRIIFSAVFIVVTATGFCQNILLSRPCITNPIYRFFDFWIGDWDAYGKNGKAGESHISVILDSCVILEEWTSTQPGYAGKSFNSYNPVSRMWQQTWVDNKGGVTNYVNSAWEQDKMVVTTNNEKQPDGTWKMQRITFTKLDEDRVRQFGEVSADGGLSWTVSFDLEYRRRKS